MRSVALRSVAPSRPGTHGLWSGSARGFLPGPREAAGISAANRRLASKDPGDADWMAERMEPELPGCGASCDDDECSGPRTADRFERRSNCWRVGRDSNPRLRFEAWTEVQDIQMVSRFRAGIRRNEREWGHKMVTRGRVTRGRGRSQLNRPRLQTRSGSDLDDHARPSAPRVRRGFDR